MDQVTPDAVFCIDHNLTPLTDVRRSFVFQFDLKQTCLSVISKEQIQDSFPKK